MERQSFLRQAMSVEIDAIAQFGKLEACILYRIMV